MKINVAEKKIVTIFSSLALASVIAAMAYAQDKAPVAGFVPLGVAVVETEAVATGWRVGWLCAPAHLLDGIVKVHQYAIMSAPTTAQDAALRALTDGERDVRSMVAEYDRRRRLVVDGFNALGLPTFEPRGAFYAFPEVTTATGLDSETFAQRLLQEEHVAVVPGGAFGPSDAPAVRVKNTSSSVGRRHPTGRAFRRIRQWVRQ